MVKVFILNEFNYLVQHKRVPEVELDLDGLLPSYEENHHFQKPAIQRHRHCLTFPYLTQPGTYLIELIGHGISSRILIRKGHLKMTQHVLLRVRSRSVGFTNLSLKNLDNQINYLIFSHLICHIFCSQKTNSRK